MKKLIILFVSFLCAAGFTACGPKGGVEEEDHKKDPQTVVVTPGNDIVVYEANEKIFAKSGSLKAIDARLSELEELGINVLWLMPIHPVGQKNSVNSPYCVRDFKAVNPDYGTLDDLKTLVAHAHDKKMRVILDWIANHSALDNAWLTEHPEWYGEPSGEETNWKDVKPFNFSNKNMRAAMIDAMTYWVKTADIDGFRCDFAQGAPDDFWAEAIAAIRAIKPEAILLAETSRLELFEAGFDWMYSWSYLAQVQNLMNAKSTSALYAISDDEMGKTPKGKQRLRYVTNHDASSEKSNSSIYKSAEGMLAASCLTYFLGGIPMIYSSQEIGYMNSINFCVPTSGSVQMDWNSKPEILAKTKKLMQVYHQTATLRGGQQTRLTADPSVACLLYTSDEGKLAVLVNLKNEEVAYPLPMDLQGTSGVNLLTDETVSMRRDLKLAAYGYLVVKI